MAAFTSLFHHGVSLHGGAPPRDSLSIFLATLLTQLAILFHIVLGSSWAFQSASCTLDLQRLLGYLLLACHYLTLGFNLRLIYLIYF